MNLSIVRGTGLCVVALSVGLVAASCGSSSPAGGGGGDAGGDATDGSVPATDAPSFGETGARDAGTGIPCDEVCPGGLVCQNGVCAPPQPTCFTNKDCQFDTYCDTSGHCATYCAAGAPCSDPTCKLAVAAGVLAPKVKCEFSTPPPGDAFPSHVDVQATPIVVAFDKPSAGPPSIVAPFTAPVADGYTETLGILRVLRGTDCSLVVNLGGTDLDADGKIDWVRSSSPVAVADLDGDGVADIVAYMGDDTTVAFTRKAGVWKPLWPKVKATLADGTTPFVSALGGGWAGPSIHDLDDDGFPEIIREAYVIDGRTGKLRAPLPPDYETYDVGIPAVLADLDRDGVVELTNGAHVWKFDKAGSQWTAWPPYDAQFLSNPGWVAVGDMNAYDGAKAPEIAVSTGGSLYVYALDHSTFMGMSVPVPGGGGGPPTIADYDGDGLPEIGLAGANFYTVFDPDCQATPRPGGKCGDRTHCESFPNGACPDRVLWSRKSQDQSSNVTGSSVFDFEASGIADVVYADECFARVYSGVDGRVLFSQYHSSCTWLENPVIADVDGDFRAEMVVASNTACGPIGVGIACGGLDANGVDAQFAGLICQKGSDCVSGVCDQGLCRCTAGAQCCAAGTDAACLETGYACVPPPAGTPGTGSTCRAAHPHGVQGIRVYKDAADRWVRSRTIWNQHAYAVTHVNEDGTVPKTSTWVQNWTAAGLDNFRQNVPGTGDGTAIGDITAQAAPSFTCSGGQANLSAEVCNRGTAPVGAGIPVGFYVGANKVCAAVTASAIDVGKCVVAGCAWGSPPIASSDAVDVTVVPNDGHAVQECDTENDKGLVEKVFCVPPR